MTHMGRALIKAGFGRSKRKRRVTGKCRYVRFPRRFILSNFLIVNR